MTQQPADPSRRGAGVWLRLSLPRGRGGLPVDRDQFDVEEQFVGCFHHAWREPGPASAPSRAESRVKNRRCPQLRAGNWVARETKPLLEP